jgi:hypothetical protein
MNAPFFVPTNTRTLLMISPVWVVINSFSTLRRTNAAAQDNFPEINYERASVLTETPPALNRKKLNPQWTRMNTNLRESSWRHSSTDLPRKYCESC